MTWAEAFRDGCTAITELGGAIRGDRTMLDALLPAVEAVEKAATSGSPSPPFSTPRQMPQQRAQKQPRTWPPKRADRATYATECSVIPTQGPSGRCLARSHQDQVRIGGRRLGEPQSQSIE